MKRPIAIKSSIDIHFNSFKARLMTKGVRAAPSKSTKNALEQKKLSGSFANKSYREMEAAMSPNTMK